MIKHRRMAHGIEGDRSGIVSVEDIDLSVCPAAAAAARGQPFLVGQQDDASRSQANRRRGGGGKRRSPVQAPMAVPSPLAMPWSFEASAPFASSAASAQSSTSSTSRPPSAKRPQQRGADAGFDSSALRATFSRATTSGRKRTRSRKAAHLDETFMNSDVEYDEEAPRSKRARTTEGGMTEALAQLAETAKEAQQQLGPMPRGVRLLHSANLSTASGEEVSLAHLISIIPPGYVLAPRASVLRPGEPAAERGIIDPDQLRYLAASQADELQPLRELASLSQAPPIDAKEGSAADSGQTASAPAVAASGSVPAASRSTTPQEDAPAATQKADDVGETDTAQQGNVDAADQGGKKESDEAPRSHQRLGADPQVIMDRLVFTLGPTGQMVPAVLQVEAGRVAIAMEHHWPSGVQPTVAPDLASIVRRQAEVSNGIQPTVASLPRSRSGHAGSSRSSHAGATSRQAQPYMRRVPQSMAIGAAHSG